MANLVTQYLQQNALEQQNLERQVKAFNNPDVDIKIPFGEQSPKYTNGNKRLNH